MTSKQPLNFAIRHIPQSFSYAQEILKWQETYLFTMDDFGSSNKEQCEYGNELINTVVGSFKQHLQNYTEQKESIYDTMLETALLINEFTKSSGVKPIRELELPNNYRLISEVHLYVREGDLIYRYKKKRMCATFPTKWKIGQGTVVSAYVAETLNYIITETGLHSQLFPLGVGRKDAAPEILLCMPIVTPNKDLLGVLELSRDDNTPYSASEVDLVIAITAWMAASISVKLPVNLMYEERAKQFCIIQQLYNNSNNIDNFISDIMVFIRDAVKASEVHYYSVLSEKDYLVQVFLETQENKNKLVKQLAQFKVPEHNYLLRYVISTQCVVNLSREEDAPETWLDKDVKSVIYYPVQANSKLLGVIVLRNKVNGEIFTDADKNLIFRKSVFLKAGLSYCFTEFERHYTKLTVEKQMKGLLYHMTPCHHEMELLDRLKAQPTLEPNIVLFNWIPENTNDDYLIMCILVMFELLFEENMSLKDSALKMFIAIVKTAQRKKPFHNFMNALTSVHCMFFILWSSGKCFSEVEKMSMIIAALCYNTDHQGYTNNFFRLTNHHMTNLYMDSYNEWHNSYITDVFINHSQLLNNLTEQIKREIKTEIETLILSTNLKLYFQTRAKLYPLLPNGFDWISRAHKNWLKTIIMTSCAFSPHFKRFKISRENAYKMYEEFHYQGKEELSLGLVPLVAMNPKNAKLIPQNQAALLTAVVEPCLDMLCSILPHTKEMLNTCRKVLERWKMIAQNESEQQVVTYHFFSN